MSDPAKPAPSGSATVVVAPPPPPPPPAKEEEKKDEEVKVPTVETKAVNVEAAAGYNFSSGFGNNRHDPHKGLQLDFRIGYPRINLLSNGNLYLRPELYVSHSKVSASLENEFGAPSSSSAALTSLGVGATLGYDFWRWTGAFIGFNFGATHVGSTAPEDGESGDQGLRYANNALKYSADNWGPMIAWRVGVKVPEQKITDWLGLGGSIFYQGKYNSFNLTPDAIDRSPNDPPIGVGNVNHAVMFGLNFTVGDSPTYKSSSSAKQADAPAADSAAPVAPAAPAAPAVPKAVSDIQAMVDPMKADVKKAMDQNYSSNTLALVDIAANKSKSKTERKDAADLAIRNAQEVSAAYKVASGKLADAKAALEKVNADASISEDNKKLAKDAVAALQTEADKLKDEAHATWESAGKAVKAYNETKGLKKAEMIEFKDADPAKAAEPASPAPAAPVKPPIK
ncbi:MAG: hypothetical protein U1F57_00900 [bacterium]